MMYARSVRPHKLRKIIPNDIRGGIHTFSQYIRNQTSYTFHCQCTYRKCISAQPNRYKYRNVNAGSRLQLNTSIYVYPYIYFRIKATRRQFIPTIKYAPYTHASMHIQQYQNQLSPTARSHLAVMPLINLPSYLDVEAFDLYITIQVNGIHTIARRMDDESKTPPMLVLKQPPNSP